MKYWEFPPLKNSPCAPALCSLNGWCNYWKKLEVRLTNLKFWSHILIHLKWFCKKLKHCHLFSFNQSHPSREGEIPLLSLLIDFVHSFLTFTSISCQDPFWNIEIYFRLRRSFIPQVKMQAHANPQGPVFLPVFFSVMRNQMMKKHMTEVGRRSQVIISPMGL